MRSRVNLLRCKLEIPVIKEGDDRLVLLGDESDEIRFAVAVEVRDGHMNGAVAVIHAMRLEVRLVPAGGAVFQHHDLAYVKPAEDGDDEIELLVAVEVSHLNVGD